MVAPLPPRKRVFLVFEGGGAKGVVHVGALRALERHDVEIAGVAGTSAGAIVAALVAAGHDSQELIAADGSSPVLRSIGLEHATDFFGRDWTRLAIARWASSDPMLASFFVFLPCLLSALAVILWLDASMMQALLMLVGMATILAVAIAYRLAHGLAKLDLLVEKLEQALAAKLGLPAGEPVLFRHFDTVGRPLRVVATDLAARRLKLFSSAESPTVRVAEAVAASAALPLACGHRVIDDRMCIDGGIVSNLPAWTFDEERALDPDAVTVAITIDDGRKRSDTMEISPHGVLLAVLLAAMFGRRHLETRAAPRLLSLPLSTDIQVVDFDLPRERVVTALDDAERAAEARIAERLFNLPRRFEEACAKIREQVDGRIAREGPDLGTSRTRVLVALRDPGAVRSWRIQHGIGFLPTDADDQLLLPEGSTVVGRAALQGRPFLEVRPFAPELALSGPVNRYRKALVRPDLEWCLAIPIYRPQAAPDAEPAAVLCIDSNVDVRYFRFNADAVDTLAQEAETLLSPAIESALDLR